MLEATCPLVHLAHRAVARLVRDGFHPVIIGKRDHVEVRGLTEDLKAFDVVLREAGRAGPCAERPRFGVVAQTTQPIDRVRELVGLMRRRFPDSEVRFIDTVCQPTKQRQHAAIELAQQCDVVIVIGGAHSNNTHELVEHLQPLLPAGASCPDGGGPASGMVRGLRNRWHHRGNFHPGSRDCGSGKPAEGNGRRTGLCPGQGKAPPIATTGR